MKKVITIFIVSFIFIFLLRNIFNNWGEIQGAFENFNSSRLLLIFVVIGSLHLLNITSWHLLTKAMNFNISFSKNIAIWMLPNLSRYIPGVVWQYFGRIYLLSQAGVSKARATLAVALDAVFTFSIAAFVVMITLLSSQPIFLLILLTIIALPGITIILASNKKVIQLLIQILRKISKKEYPLNVVNFNYKWIAVLVVVTCSQFIIAGAALYMLAVNFNQPLQPELVITFSGIYAGSWILGYLSFFAPGGLGVQEISITGLLATFMPLPIASLCALLFRFILTLTEVLISLTIFLLREISANHRFPILHKGR